MSLLKRKLREPKPSRRFGDLHPVIHWGTIASVFTVLSVAGPLVSSWLGGFEKADHAKEEIAKIYRGLGELGRALAWNAAATVKTERTVAENRVADCDIKASRGEKATDIELIACAKWRADAEDAKRRYQEAFAAAQKASKAIGETAAKESTKD